MPAGRARGRRRPADVLIPSLEDDMSDATDLVDRQIAAYRARDLEQFLSFYAEDVRIRDFDGNAPPTARRGRLGAGSPPACI